jgi:tetratricopeptide (TPR) repeat protein
MSVRLSCLSLLALASCGTFGLSSEQRALLSQHQERAQLYYNGNRLPQALDQVRQGLEIEPTDYKLHTMRGYCLLRQANDPRYATTPARRRGLLEEASAAFAATLALRSPGEHGPQALLGDALLHEELGRFQLEMRKQADSEQGPGDMNEQDRALREVRLHEHDVQMKEHLLRAEHQLNLLIDRGDLLLLAHKHMLSVKALRGDYAAAVEQGRAYLERAQAQQASRRKLYETTDAIGDEQRAQQELAELLTDEIVVRAQLANLHYDQQNYQAAATELDRILTLDPTRAADYYNRARALFELKRFDEAYKDVQKFLATHTLPSGHPTVTRAHELLRQLETKR